jgi:hypothetical protein
MLWEVSPFDHRYALDWGALRVVSGAPSQNSVSPVTVITGLSSEVLVTVTGSLGSLRQPYSLPVVTSKLPAVLTIMEGVVSPPGDHE